MARQHPLLLCSLGLASAGYRIWTQVIPDEITPKNRLLIGAFDDGPVSS